MTTEEAIQELEEMRVIVELNGDLAPYKERIKSLYWEVCRKHLRQCKCKNILKDAFLEIYSRLRQNKKKIVKTSNMAQARLVMGVVLKWENNHYTNKNLTDEIARAFLAKFPQRKDWFEVLPSATTEKAVVAEVADTPEKDAEEPSKKAEAPSKPTAPTKKKDTKKGK